MLGTARQENIEYINKDLISAASHPCARGIANAWHEFRSKLYENDGNLYSACLFSNPGIRNRMNEMVGGGNIFGQGRYETKREDIWEIQLVFLRLEDGTRDKLETEKILGIGLSNLAYNRLKGTINYIWKKTNQYGI